MVANLQPEPALKKTQMGFICGKCLKEQTTKRVRLSLKPVYNKLQAIERFNRRMVTLQQLIEGKHVSTGKLLLLLIEVRFTVRVLERRCKTNNWMVL